MSKTQDYKHKLTFVSNTDMSLKYSPNDEEKKEGKEPVSIKVNEMNEIQSFNNLHADIRNKIDGSVKDYCKKNTKTFDKGEFNNLILQWADFPKTANKQREALIGLMHSKFPHVVDPKASIELFIELFRKVEQTYNQGNVARLLDESKRLYAEDLKATLDIIEKEQRTYEKWRNHAQTFAPIFKIPLSVQDSAKDKIRETFEYLKDLNNLDHKKIQKFIYENDYREKYYSVAEMFKGYVSEVRESEHINLNNIDIFFTCLCAYVEFYDEGNL